MAARITTAVSATDFLDGEIRGATFPDGTPIALYSVNGTFYATHDTCTHEHASLSAEGTIEDRQVICGWHFCGFDLATGAATASPCYEPIRTFPVTVVDGVLHVEY